MTEPGSTSSLGPRPTSRSFCPWIICYWSYSRHRISPCFSRIRGWPSHQASAMYQLSRFCHLLSSSFSHTPATVDWWHHFRPGTSHNNSIYVISPRSLRCCWNCRRLQTTAAPTSTIARKVRSSSWHSGAHLAWLTGTDRFSDSLFYLLASVFGLWASRQESDARPVPQRSTWA